MVSSHIPHGATVSDTSTIPQNDVGNDLGYMLRRAWLNSSSVAASTSIMFSPTEPLWKLLHAKPARMAVDPCTPVEASMVTKIMVPDS